MCFILLPSWVTETTFQGLVPTSQLLCMPHTACRMPHIACHMQHAAFIPLQQRHMIPGLTGICPLYSRKQQALSP